MNKKRTWGDDEKHAFEVWKYYGSIGGNDKDRMIQIVTWLLGFSAGIIGFYASGRLMDPLGKLLLITLGILISLLAALAALLYGGYALRNWSIADQIARDYDWTEQKQNYKPSKLTNPNWSAKVSLWMARPSNKYVAPVFWIFFAASLGSLIVHLVLLKIVF